MTNMLDYLLWRGDLTFAERPFNAVDGLILAQMSYFRWELALPEGGSGTLAEIAPLLADKSFAGANLENDRLLLSLVAASARFGAARVTHYVHEFEESQEKQFAAAAFALGDGTLFLSFRGTDGTIVGWKEDFNMAFSEPVASQKRALEYLRAVAEEEGLPIRLGGHSKGGNLAVYAAAMAEPELQPRIRGVYSYDGPGLSDQIDSGALYSRIAGRLHSFVPQSSLVGMLLSYYREYTIVSSDSFGILQHNPYYWHVRGAAFVAAGARSRSSAYFEAVIRKWLSGIGEDERRTLVDALFDVLSATQAESFGKDLWSGILRNPGAVAAVIQGFDPAVRQKLTRMLAELGSAALHAGEDELKSLPEQ